MYEYKARKTQQESLPALIGGTLLFGSIALLWVAVPVVVICALIF